MAATGEPRRAHLFPLGVTLGLALALTVFLAANYSVFRLVQTSADAFGEARSSALRFVAAATLVEFLILLGISLVTFREMRRREATERELATAHARIQHDLAEHGHTARRQSIQHAATRAIAEAVSFEDSMPLVLEALGTSIDWDYTGFWRVDAADASLHPVAFWSSAGPAEAFAEASRRHTLGREDSLPGQVWAKGVPLWGNLTTRRRAYPRFVEAEAAGLRTGFAAPVNVGGDVLGVVEIFCRREEDEDPGLLEVFGVIGAQIGQFMERDAADKALRAANERTKAVVDGMLEGLIVTDARNVIVAANPATERMFGYQSWELVGQHLSILMPEEHTAEANAFLARARQRSIGRITEWKGRRKDGSLFPFELANYEIQTPEGRNYVGHVRDISERDRLERLQKEFVANVSHELRTPLTSIRGSLGLLTAGALGQLPDEAREVVEIAQRNTLRLINLINGILDLERFEAGRTELQLAPVSARELAERGIESVKAFAAEHSVRIEPTVTDDLMLGDAARLVQVVVNLLGNAVKFSPPGGVVEITSRPLAKAIEVRVADRGRGIPAEDIDRIFRRFQQLPTQEVREKGGTGLGLAISKAIVEQHGGEIGAESTTGLGTTFWFRIPTVPEGPAELTVHPTAIATKAFPAPPPPEPLVVPAAKDRLLATLQEDSLASSGPDILVVDDDDAVLGVLARQFLSAGWPVRVARTAADARTQARRRRPGMVVLDLGLPDGSGFEVVAAFREDPALHDMPLLVYTGRDLSAEERRRLRLGRTRFMTKSKATNEEVTAAALDLLGAAATVPEGS